MGYRKFVITCLLGLSIFTLKAQTLTYQQVDSVTYAQYVASDWQALVKSGNQALAASIDFPLLRLRIGYANFSIGKYSAALHQYSHVIATDAHSETAHYYSYLCNSYLNRDPVSFYHLSFVDTNTLKAEELSRFGLIKAGVESGIKVPEIANRDNITYSRIFVSNRLGWRLTLDQSAAYFAQPTTTSATATKQIVDSQPEYYLKLTYTLSPTLSLLGGYHFFYTSYQQNSYSNNAALLGLKFRSSYFDLQADADFSSISGDSYKQYNGKLYTYPLGNLDFYTLTTFSRINGTTSANVFSQLFGFKVSKNFFAEAGATFGRLNNYFEYDALYIYNAIDVTTFKAGATIFYQLNKHALIYANFTNERKADVTQNIDYKQNSITGGFTWRF